MKPVQLCIFGISLAWKLSPRKSDVGLLLTLNVYKYFNVSHCVKYTKYETCAILHFLASLWLGSCHPETTEVGLLLTLNVDKYLNVSHRVKCTKY